MENKTAQNEALVGYHWTEENEIQKIIIKRCFAFNVNLGLFAGLNNFGFIFTTLVVVNRITFSNKPQPEVNYIRKKCFTIRFLFKTTRT